MSLALQHPAPPVVVTLVLNPRDPDRPVEVLPAAPTPLPDPATARRAEPHDEPTWEDAAWY